MLKISAHKHIINLEALKMSAQCCECGAAGSGPSFMSKAQRKKVPEKRRCVACINAGAENPPPPLLVVSPASVHEPTEHTASSFSKGQMAQIVGLSGSVHLNGKAVRVASLGSQLVTVVATQHLSPLSPVLHL